MGFGTTRTSQLCLYFAGLLSASVLLRDGRRVLSIAALESCAANGTHRIFLPQAQKEVPVPFSLTRVARGMQANLRQGQPRITWSLQGALVPIYPGTTPHTTAAKLPGGNNQRHLLSPSGRQSFSRYINHCSRR
ncbi:hypothetical protein XELAEV_18024109mg [Xenopus laevis]|uniref:Uncharacterized protein n=1 Tax=Xenopus laevis TaxID=8355 RepID=A0A974HPX4_XENLA|nr:hypothetical protein XELAEV_18024109mg [Xenopus laevis]